MGKGFVKYNSNWQKEFIWLKPMKNDESMAYCDFCLKSFKIDNGGIAQVCIVIFFTIF